MLNYNPIINIWWRPFIPQTFSTCAVKEFDNYGKPGVCFLFFFSSSSVGLCSSSSLMKQRPKCHHHHHHHQNPLLLHLNQLVSHMSLMFYQSSLVCFISHFIILFFIVTLTSRSLSYVPFFFVSVHIVTAVRHLPNTPNTVSLSVIWWRIASIYTAWN